MPPNIIVIRIIPSSVARIFSVVLFIGLLNIVSIYNLALRWYLLKPLILVFGLILLSDEI